MAVTKTTTRVNAVAVFQLRLDGSGKPVLKNKIISNIDTEATDAGIFSLVETIASLQKLVLAGIERRDYNELANV